jgi:hypothetical protein
MRSAGRIYCTAMLCQSCMNKNTKNQWNFIAQIDLDDFLNLADVKDAYLQNYLDKGYTEIKFEQIGQKKYKIFMKRPLGLKFVNKNNPRAKALFQIATLPARIKLLKSQLKNFPAKKREITDEIAFWQIALKNYRAKKVLADWEAGLPENLRKKMRERKYLPTQAEVNKIPFKQRESYQEEFFDYEIWNREYIKILANYLAQYKNAVILEVGAGSGRLSYFLRKKLPNNLITAIDISLKHKVSGILLVKMSMKNALRKFKPDILICAWPDSFFWQEIKHNSSAKKIILIGDAEDTPLAKEVKGEWQWLPIKGFKVKEFLPAQKVQTSRDSLGTTLIYFK